MEFLASTEEAISVVNILTNAGPSVLLGLGIWALIKGWVISPRERDQIVKELEKVAKQEEYWRLQVERLNQKVFELTSYTTEITKTATKAVVSTTKNVVESTPKGNSNEG
jgi:hypothetical protein